MVIFCASPLVISALLGSGFGTYFSLTLICLTVSVVPGSMFRISMRPFSSQVYSPPDVP